MSQYNADGGGGKSEHIIVFARFRPDWRSRPELVISLCPWCGHEHKQTPFGPHGLGGPRISCCRAPGAPRQYWLVVANPDVVCLASGAQLFQGIPATDIGGMLRLFPDLHAFPVRLDSPRRKPYRETTPTEPLRWSAR
jgi:hypothetical protein